MVFSVICGFIRGNERTGQSMINEKNIATITEEINLVCQIHGISSEGRIDFKDATTEAQKAAARAIMAKYYP